MNLGTSRQRHQKRNNRNFFIISIGFICSLIVAIFAIENMMMSIEKKKQQHILHCEIENQCAAPIISKLKIGDVILYEDSLEIGKTVFEKSWHFDSCSCINAIFADTVTNFCNISVRDSIGYLMIQVQQKNNGLEIKESFFE